MRRGLLAATVAGAVLAGPAAALGSSAEVPSGLDQQYLSTAIKGDVWEVASGKLAQRMGHDARVQALGRQVAKDHAKSLAEAMALAKRLGIKVERKPTATEEWALSLLKANPTTFDHLYASLAVADHRDDIVDASEEVRDGSAQAVRDAALKELPTLHKHLRMALAAERGSS